MGAEQLRAAGFPAERIRRGPTLRYQHLLSTIRNADPDRTAVLVLISQETSAATELLMKLRTALGATPEIRVWLKLHPLMPSAVFRRCLGGRPLPLNFVRVEGPIEEWLDRAGCIVTLGGSSALEVALRGVPVVVVGRDSDFDFDALGWFDEFPCPTVEPEAIRARVKTELAAPESRRRALAAWAAQTLAWAVAPVTDDGIMAFVKRPPRVGQHEVNR
jgi:hypothetical protein